MQPLFDEKKLDAEDLGTLDRDGYVVLPGWIAADARGRLTDSLGRVEALAPDAPKETRPRRFAAEHDRYLRSLVTHPQLLALARAALGRTIRFDHCVCLNRAPGYPGMRWHSHGYGEDDPKLGFLRIFLYVGGFGPEDGALKVVPGSHRWRDPGVQAPSDEALRRGWLAGRLDSSTGAPLAIESLSAPPGSLVAMWTHTVHGVGKMSPTGETRRAVVFGYRNPGRTSPSRWITRDFEQRAEADTTLAELLRP